MSDCFDHELDAWESYDHQNEYDYSGQYSNDFVTDPNFHHDLYHFKSIKKRTPKAILFVVHDEYTEKDKEVWIPKSLCRDLNIESSTVLIWEGFDFLN